MSKTLTFTVTVEFSNKIYDDNENKEVAEKILNAIIEQANHEGLAPEASEAFTKSVTVNSEVLDINVSKKL